MNKILIISISLIIFISCGNLKKGTYYYGNDHTSLALTLYPDSTFYGYYFWGSYSSLHQCYSLGEYNIVGDTIVLATVIPNVNDPIDAVMQFPFFNVKDYLDAASFEFHNTQDEILLSICYKDRALYEPHFKIDNKLDLYSFSVLDSHTLQNEKISFSSYSYTTKYIGEKLYIDTLSFTLPIADTKNKYLTIRYGHLDFFTLKMGDNTTNQKRHITIENKSFGIFSHNPFQNITGDKFFIKNNRLIPLKTNKWWTNNLKKAKLKRTKNGDAFDYLR